MKALLVCLVAIAGVGVATAQPQVSALRVATLTQTSSPSFVFKAVEVDGMPNTTVSLKVGAKTTVLKKVVGNASALPASELNPKVKGALAACKSWWAGQGDEFYVVKKGAEYQVYHRTLEEESAPGKFKLLKKIKA
ncbi:MAG: hypothetical protein KIS66_15780 [Fimbriimonadaceae bacterium]|nr:hypothetical protein [Fimbriimonadaceae bacterium]